MKPFRLLLIVSVACAGFAIVATGCGGAPPNNNNLGFTARCVDGTLTSDCPYPCYNNGGVAETFIGCDDGTNAP